MARENSLARIAVGSVYFAFLGSSDLPKSEVDAGFLHFGGFGEAVQPVVLGGAFHHQKGAVPELALSLFGLQAVFKTKAPRRPKTERGDHRVPAERFFIIAMPAHALRAVCVGIEQAGVKHSAANLLDQGFELSKFRRPGKGGASDARVGVGALRVAIPGHSPGGGDVFAKKDDFILPPGGGLIEN